MSNKLIASEIFFTKGCGVHKDKLQSFELALRKAGMAACNIVCVSSIFPPGAKIISKEEGLKKLHPGEITFVVMARNETNEPNRLISAAVGLAIPTDKTTYGYLSEHHEFGQVARKSGEYAEDLAATMLASTLGIEFDSTKAYDERKQQYKMSKKIVKTMSTVQSAEGEKNGCWTTVVAIAVLLMNGNNNNCGEESDNNV